MHSSSRFLFAALALLAPAALTGQTARIVLNPYASYIDVTGRRAELEHAASPRVREAVRGLQSCRQLPVVDAPAGPMLIPHHYLSGSHGATNPAEHEATRLYGQFEKRVTAGMNRFVASGDEAEAQCAQAQIDRWAQAGALLNYDAKKSSQSWFQTEWTLSAIATSESVLVNDRQLDKAILTRDIAWMNRVAHRLIGVPGESEHTNNHHDWRGLAALATGVVSQDAQLFAFGVAAYKNAIDQLDARGALPQEMARHERAIHYQSFALQPLITIAAFAQQQGVPLYGYTSASGRTIDDAIRFLGEAVADPAVVKPYTDDAQLRNFDAPDFFAALEFYHYQFPERKLPAAIEKGLRKPTMATRLGGSTTVLAGL